MPYKPKTLSSFYAKVRPIDPRESPSKRGYGRTWQKLRKMVLGAEPLCRECFAHGLIVAATDVDHITPKREGGENAFQNLQPLCRSCHSRKTASKKD